MDQYSPKTDIRKDLPGLPGVGGQGVDLGEGPATATDGNGAGDPRPTGEAGHRERGIDGLARRQHFEPETVHRYLLSERREVALCCYCSQCGAICQEGR